MLEAIRLAEKGRGKVSPNPMVGAVVVKNGKIVGKGWHERFSARHAEVNALKKAGKKAMGADLYVTLEPCNHYGKQPPCTKAILEAGIKRVYFACGDPNKASRHGAKELVKKGVMVIGGIHGKEAEKQNEFYIKSVCLGRPFITIKIAMTRNGFISWGNGKRKRVSGQKSSEFAQLLREKHDGIMVGIGTMLNDDPMLSVRGKPWLNPARIILDSGARMSPRAKVFSQKGKTIIVCTKKALKKDVEALRKRGAEIIMGKSENGRVDLRWLMKKLYTLGMRSLLAEPGKELATSLLERKLFDRLIIIVAEKEPKSGLAAFKLKKTVRVHLAAVERSGKDLILVGE